MPFPDTRLTLIARLAAGGSEGDWQQFLADYWRPVARFASRMGRLPEDQSEDVAAETMLVLVRSPLLARWQGERTGKLRSLLCGVVRNILSNQQRIALGRQRLVAQLADQGGIPDRLPVSESAEPSAGDLDAFYQAWVDELLASALRTLLAELHAEGRGDYFRALYGRVCEELGSAEIGEALGVDAATVANQLRVARSRLARTLEELVRKHVQRYGATNDADADFRAEWKQLGDHLERHGGLEQVLRGVAAELDHLPGRQRSAVYEAVSVHVGQGASPRASKPPI